MTDRAPTNAQLERVQKIAHKCYGHIIGREQAIDVWCLATFNKSNATIALTRRNIDGASYRAIVKGCRQLEVHKNA